MVLEQGTYEIVVLIGTLLGLTVRTGFYFYAKQKEDSALGLEPRPFEKKYLVTAGIAGIMIVTGAFMAFPLVAASVPNSASLIAVLSGSFIAAIGLNELFNRLLTLIGTTPVLVQQVETNEPTTKLTKTVG